MENQEKFWKIRSEKYNNLDWVKEPSYLRAFIAAGNFDKCDLVLDVGTGTGIIAHAIAPLINSVIGLDISQDMLDHSNWQDNKYFIKRDIRHPIFRDSVFDKVTARMVFHHIVDQTQEAMDECFRVLKKGGKMILSEGVPPRHDIVRDYIKIFKVKEKRLTFFENDLVSLMRTSGFKNIKSNIHIMKNFSVKNWLTNGNLPKYKRDKIFKMHIHGSDSFKEAYNLRITEHDCLIDVTNTIIAGEK